MNAYNALPALIETARLTSWRFDERVRIVGTRSSRCGLWHYVIIPTKVGRR